MTPFDEKDPTDGASQGLEPKSIPSLDDTGEAAGPSARESESPPAGSPGDPEGPTDAETGDGPANEFAGESVEPPSKPGQTES